MAENEQYASWTNEKYEPVKKHRAKKYTLVVYPQDMPENWREVLREKMWDVLISPLHDKDVNADNEPKKPHHHVIVSAGSSWITMNALVELGKKLKGVAKPQKCSNPKGMVRYFVHADNPEKAQYDKSKIEVYGNYDIEDYFKSTIGEERAIRKEIVEYILENAVDELADLVEYSMYHNELWDDYIASHTIYINEIIRSVRHGRKSKTEVKADPETGEIIE